MLRLPRHGLGCAKLAMVAMLAGCGAADQPQQPAPMSLTSPAFDSGAPIPAQFGCDARDEPPPLRWSDPPPRTRSFALVLEDPDAPGGTFGHWGVTGIPATARSLGPGDAAGAAVVNDFGKRAYGGPCPPPGGGRHHYRFRLFALDTDRLELPADASVADLEKAARGHALAVGELIGTYERGRSR